MYAKKRCKEAVDGGPQERSVCVGVACGGQKKYLLLQTGEETELAGDKNIGNTVRTQQ